MFIDHTNEYLRTNHPNKGRTGTCRLLAQEYNNPISYWPAMYGLNYAIDDIVDSLCTTT